MTQAVAAFTDNSDIAEHNLNAWQAAELGSFERT
jgi:hypothetical protein